MKYDIRDIKKELKNGDLVYWYNTDSKLVLSGDTKISTLKELNKKNLKNGTKLIRLVISFHSGEKIGQGGPIAVNSKLFEVMDNKVKKNKWGDKLIGYVWFGLNFLERTGWKKYFMTDIINKLNSGNFGFVFGVTKYEKNIM